MDAQTAHGLARALRLADPALSRFDPLPRIIAFDDFDRGFCGWTQLVGNYEHTLDSMLPGYAQHTQADALDPVDLGLRQPRRASTAPTR